MEQVDLENEPTSQGELPATADQQRQLIFVLERLFSVNFQRSVGSFLPIFRFFDPVCREAETRMRWIEAYMEQQMAEYERAGSDKARGPLLDAMLREYHRGVLARKDILSLILMILAAGSDTGRWEVV